MSESHYLPVFLSHFSLTAALSVFKCCVGQKLTFAFFRAPRDTAFVPVPGCMIQQFWLIFPGSTLLCLTLPHEHPMLAACLELLLAKGAHTDVSPLVELMLAGEWMPVLLPMKLL